MYLVDNHLQHITLAVEDVEEAAPETYPLAAFNIIPLPSN
jgi:hypothetical protein